MYYVNTQTKGILKFNSIPDNAYICEGLQDIKDKGLICWFGFDNGTCLIPFKDSAGNKLYNINGKILTCNNFNI